MFVFPSFFQVNLYIYIYIQTFKFIFKKFFFNGPSACEGSIELSGFSVGCSLLSHGGEGR